MASTSYQQQQLAHRAHTAHTLALELLEQLCQDAAALDARQQADEQQRLDDFLLLEQRACSETAAAEAVGADLALLLAPGLGASASYQRETEAFLLRLWLLDFELSACSSKQLGDEPSTPPRAMAAEDKTAVGAFEIV
eukprot:jgi/Tetstr1/461733/TSEL_006823.t1